MQSTNLPLNGGEQLETDDEVPVRDFHSIENQDKIVRNYQIPPGQHLYAYRTDDRQHHIVVSDGNKPRTQWVAHEPAYRRSAIVNQKLWTIPNNWEQIVYLKRNNRTYGLYRIKIHRIWVLVSLPTNRELTDAYYQVQAVGDLNIDSIGEIGTAAEIHAVASKRTSSPEMQAALHEVAENRDVLKDELSRAKGGIRFDDLKQLGSDGATIRTNDNWEIEFHYGRTFEPVKTLKRELDLSEYDICLEDLLEVLRGHELLPSLYRFKLSFPNSSFDN